MILLDGLHRAIHEHVRPSWRRVLKACLALSDAGKPWTGVNLARALGTSPQNVSEMQLRHRAMMPWINRVLEESNPSYVASVVRRTAHLAQQGSIDHTKVYLQFMSGGFSRPAPFDGPLEPAALPGGPSFVVNLLVPRPEYPQAQLQAAQQVRLPPPDLPTRAVEPAAVSRR